MLAQKRVILSLLLTFSAYFTHSLSRSIDFHVAGKFSLIFILKKKREGENKCRRKEKLVLSIAVVLA